MASKGAPGWDSAWESATVEDELATLEYPWVQSSLAFIARHLRPDSPVLEAGCGPGRFLHWLESSGYRAVGVDCSHVALAKAKAHSPALLMALADVRRLPFGDDAFATCLSFGVIEHFVEGPDGCLAEMRRVIMPHGTLVVCVPHVNLLARIDPPLKAIYRCLRRIPPPDPDSAEPPGRWYGLGELVAALRRNSFEVLETMPFGHAYALHSFCGRFRRAGAYHDVTPLGSRLGRIMERVARWSTAPAIFAAARKAPPGELK